MWYERKNILRLYIVLVQFIHFRESYQKLVESYHLTAFSFATDTRVGDPVLVLHVIEDIRLDLAVMPDQWNLEGIKSKYER